MKTSDFYFDLPEELIAQTPIPNRDRSRLLMLDKNSGAIEHGQFYQLEDMLRYKNADMRSNCIKLLMKQNDDALFGSISKLIWNKQAGAHLSLQMTRQFMRIGLKLTINQAEMK